MDINEPSLMDVTHDTQSIRPRSGANRSSEGKGQGFFHRNSGRVNLCRLLESNSGRSRGA